jgi:hypothetical protein
MPKASTNILLLDPICGLQIGPRRLQLMQGLQLVGFHHGFGSQRERALLEDAFFMLGGLIGGGHFHETACVLLLSYLCEVLLLAETKPARRVQIVGLLFAHELFKSGEVILLEAIQDVFECAQLQVLQLLTVFDLVVPLHMCWILPLSSPILRIGLWWQLLQLLHHADMPAVFLINRVRARILVWRQPRIIVQVLLLLLVIGFEAWEVGGLDAVVFGAERGETAVLSLIHSQISALLGTHLDHGGVAPGDLLIVSLLGIIVKYAHGAFCPERWGLFMHAHQIIVALWRSYLLALLVLWTCFFRAETWLCVYILLFSDVVVWG